MNTEQRIRTTAARKVKVRITSKNRSKRGFDVVTPSGCRYHARTKKEALHMMLAAVQCAAESHWRIEPTKTHGGRHD